MTKAKTIDRLELTRKKFSGSLNEHTEKVEQETQVQQEEHYGLSICPECGQMTLIHEGGCEHCSNCSYSKCG